MKIIFKKVIVYILRTEAKLILKKYKPQIIAITGSVGKTSTKDAVYAVLSQFVYVRKSTKNFNSDIGLPLTILGCPNGWNSPMMWIENFLKGLWLIIYPHKYPKWLVLEVGVGKAGDMKDTASWLKTDVVIMTAIGETPSHIEFFNSRKSLIEEKSGLIKTLKKDGLLVLNYDDEDVIDMKSKVKNRTITFGFKEGADVLGSSIDISYNNKNEPEGVSFKVDEGGNSLPVFIDGVFGRNHVYASLASIAVISAFKFNILEAINALKDYDLSPGRMRLHKGINESLIIDDTYNSSPFACRTAIETLGGIKSVGRKVAVLGDMLELGKHTIDAHKEMGKVVQENKIDLLIVVGPRAQVIKEGALEAGMDESKISEFVNSIDASEYVRNLIKTGDVVLVKGSQGMRMERVVAEIILDKENKNKLLVRQDKEWLEKE